MSEVVNKEVKNPIPQAVLGGGYSSDRQMPTVTPCLKEGNVTFSGGSKAVVGIGESVSFEEISQTLNVDVESGLNIGIFSTDVSAQYARYIKDDTFSSSFYFYSSIDLPTMIWNPPSYGPGVLNAYGSGVYQSGIQNFRDNCGDQFIQQEHPGGVLAATLKVDFNSRYDKSVFTEHSSSSFLGMTVASSTIEKISVAYDLHGSLGLSAMQIGGNAGELANIFNASASGYYVSHCEIQDLSACNKLIDSILDYSANNFANQLNYTGGTITGDAASVGYTYGKYTDVGLNASQTIITPEIENSRRALAADLEESQYYEQNFYHIIYRYPVAWNATSNIYKDMQTLYQRAQNNIAIILNPDNPDSGAFGCFDTPLQCNSIARNINASLSPITQDDLTFFGEAKFILPGGLDINYYDGSGYNAIAGPVSGNGDYFSSLGSVSITNTTFNTEYFYIGNQGKTLNTICASGTSTDGMTYNGHLTGSYGTRCGNSNYQPFSYTKITSPFYFEAYNGSDLGIDLIGESVFDNF